MTARRRTRFVLPIRIGSLEYQGGYVPGGYGISYLPESNRPENFSVPQMHKFVEWGMDPALRRIPPTVSAGARKTLADCLPGVYPPYADVLDNCYLSKSGVETLQDLDKRLDAALDTAIKKAQGDGTRVTRDDFVFPDWDPSWNYEPKKK